jgi:hypothetical protein
MTASRMIHLDARTSAGISHAQRLYWMHLSTKSNSAGIARAALQSLELSNLSRTI